nr:E3 ubiquitin-protein ligase MARCH2-like isoform X1 [Megalopta genalis]XP_033342033.1 E3 ubiquitin-protein ligase MARCH2-like isoform X2 [Megalopta genalis]
MSNEQPDDDPANDTDQPVDKPGVSSQNVSGPALPVQSLTPGQKPSKANKRENKRRSLCDQKINNDESRVSGDICRICHMGGFPRTGNSRTTRPRRSQAVRGNDSETSTASSCAYLGPLISACMCRGTVALVHAACLERWLTESGHTSCELCGYKYVTKRVPRHNIIRSVAIWFNTVIVTRQMLLDILYLIVTTPLAIFSCYICALALNMLLKNGIFAVPWMIVTMLPTCLLTLVAYWGWIITLGRLHGRRWRRYWRNNFVIRLVPNNGIAAETIPEVSTPDFETSWPEDETEEATEASDAPNESI